MNAPSLSSRKLILVGITIVLIVVAIIVINRKNADTVLQNSMAQEEETLVGFLDQANPRVQEIQRTLQVLGYTIDAPDGMMNEQTRASIKTFQADKRFKVSGFLDSITLMELDQQKILIDQTAAQSQMAGDTTLDAQGGADPLAAMASEEMANFKLDSIDEIKAVQEALQKAGLYEGAIDGKLGPKSKQAIRDFQSSHNLKVDGVVGPQTWQELQKSTSAETATY